MPGYQNIIPGYQILAYDWAWLVLAISASPRMALGYRSNQAVYTARPLDGFNYGSTTFREK